MSYCENKINLNIRKQLSSFESFYHTASMFPLSSLLYLSNIFRLFYFCLFIFDYYQFMKNQNVIVKKTVTPTIEKKIVYPSNPYNDMASLQHSQPPATSNKIPAKLNSKVVDNSRPQVLKTTKLVSPEVVKTGLLSTNSNNDSVSKLKSPSIEAGKKIVKKIVKNEKYNDYFETEMGDGKGAKRLANVSKKSSESNNSIKSIQSENKKLVGATHKDLNKVQKPIIATHSKPFPIANKNKNSNQGQTKVETSDFNELINNIPTSKNGKVGDDRKSWSYSGFNNHSKSNNSKDMDANKPFFPNIDFKNTRNTTGNPENDKKSCDSEPRNGITIQKVTKPVVTKKQGSKFVPSASKSQSPDKFKKSSDANKHSTPKLQKISLLQVGMRSQQKMHSTLANSKQQNLCSNKALLQLNQVVKLKVLSLEVVHKVISLRVLKIVAQDEKTSLYLVCEPETNFLYCLKKCLVVKEENFSKEDHLLNKLEYLIRQGKIGASLCHPNLIKTYCTLYDKENVYQLMEYIEGKNLYDRNRVEFCGKVTQRDSLGMHRNQLSFLINKIYNIKQILSQLLQALNFLHQRGVIHRDIKPANILITHENNYKIGDFGTAIWNNSAEPIGTLDYAAPEIMLKEQYNSSIDIWAVGCIAFELYVGYPPFFNENREITIKKIINCEYEHILIQDEGLANLIGKMLQKKGEKRITARETLEHPFIKQFKAIQKQL